MAGAAGRAGRVAGARVPGFGAGPPPGRPGPVAGAVFPAGRAAGRPGAPGALQFGRLLAALDGTVPGRAVHAGEHRRVRRAAAERRRDGGYPQVRLVTVTACGTRGVIDAVFRAARAAAASEQDLARKIAARGRLGPGMLMLADRNFCGYPVAAALAATGADLLFRVKVQPGLPVLEALPDGSYRSVLADPPAGPAARRCPPPRQDTARPAPPGLPSGSSRPTSPSPRRPATPHRALPADHHPGRPRPPPRQGDRRLLRPAMGNREPLPRAQGLHPRRRAGTALGHPRRHHPGNLGPAVRLPAHPRRPRRRRRRRRPRPRPHLLHRHPARHPPRLTTPTPPHRPRRGTRPLLPPRRRRGYPDSPSPAPPNAAPPGPAYRHHHLQDHHQPPPAADLPGP